MSAIRKAKGKKIMRDQKDIKTTCSEVEERCLLGREWPVTVKTTNEKEQGKTGEKPKKRINKPIGSQTAERLPEAVQYSALWCSNSNVYTAHGTPKLLTINDIGASIVHCNSLRSLIFWFCNFAYQWYAKLPNPISHINDTRNCQTQFRVSTIHEIAKPNVAYQWYAKLPNIISRINDTRWLFTGSIRWLYWASVGTFPVSR